MKASQSKTTVLEQKVDFLQTASTLAELNVQLLEKSIISSKLANSQLAQKQEKCQINYMKLHSILLKINSTLSRHNSSISILNEAHKRLINTASEHQEDYNILATKTELARIEINKAQDYIDRINGLGFEDKVQSMANKLELNFNARITAEQSKAEAMINALCEQLKRQDEKIEKLSKTQEDVTKVN